MLCDNGKRAHQHFSYGNKKTKNRLYGNSEATLYIM